MRSKPTYEELESQLELLKKQKEDYSFLLENLSNGIITYDAYGQIVDCNRMALSILGISRDGFIGSNINNDSWQFIDKDKHVLDIKEYPVNIVKELKKPIHNVIIGKVKDDENSIVWIKINANPQFDSENNISQIIVDFRDITDQVNSEFELSRRLQEIKNAQSVSKVGSWFIDKQSMAIKWTDHSYKIFGVSQDTLAPNFSDFGEYFTDNSWQLLSKSTLLTLDDGSPFTLELEFLRSDKSIGVMVAHGEVLNDKWGKATGMWTIAQDISEQKVVEAQLHTAQEIAIENEEKYKALYDNAPLSYQSLDKNGFLIDVNPLWLKTMGYTREEVIGSPFVSYMFPEMADSYKSIFSNFKKSGFINGVEFKMRKKNGEAIHVSYEGISTYKKNGDFKQTYCVFKDVTHQKKIEASLVEAKLKAEESDKLKSAFLANMSHEIRTPMNAILGFSDLLLRKDLDEDKKEKYLELINTGGKRLLTIISDIIDLSKIDANQISIKLKDCDINEMLDNLHSQFIVSADNKNVSFDVFKGLSAKAALIKSDNVRLIQIISNLLENAFKFTNTGVIRLGYTLEDNKLKFYVSDTGIGVSPKYFKLIFERFGQAKQELTKLGTGTGLGLSIVKGLLDLLGGDIWLESEEGKGSTFFFTIPYNPINIANPIEILPQSVENVVEEEPETESISTILVVEDDSSNFLYLEALFMPFNYNILHAWNGEEALDLFSNNPDIKLILMDIKMPLMNGFDATERIRKINQDIPIVAQTAFAMADDRRKAIAVGCNDYISKPISKVKLLNIISKYLS